MDPGKKIHEDPNISESIIDHPHVNPIVEETGDTFEELNVSSFPLLKNLTQKLNSENNSKVDHDEKDREEIFEEEILVPADQQVVDFRTEQLDCAEVSSHELEANQNENNSNLDTTRTQENDENVDADRQSTGVDHENLPVEGHEEQDSRDNGNLAVEMTLLLREQLKYCSSIMRSMKRHKEASPFLLPVDASALNIPDYYIIITKPMDFSTITTKLSQCKYSSVDAFIEDVQQVFKNCARYNAEGTVVNTWGKNMEKVFENLLKKMPTEESLATAALSQSHSQGASAVQTPLSAEISERARRSSAVMKRRYDSPEFEGTPLKKSSLSDLRSPYSNNNKTPASRRNSLKPSGNANMIQEDVRFLGNVIRDFFKKQFHHIAWPFLMPVDPLALHIPDYPTVISRPMDLGTMRQRVEHRAYTHPDEMKDDFLLMCNNCYTYNGPESEVAGFAQQLESHFMRKYQQRPSVNSGASGSSSYDAVHGDDDLAYVDQQIRDRQRQIQVLEGEIADLRGHKFSLQQKRRSSLTVQKKSFPSLVGKSKKPKSIPVLTFEDKRQLSFDINELQPEKLGRVLDIINESMPHLRSANPDSDEIELDIESLDANTLYKLQKYVKQCKAESRGGSNLAAPTFQMDLSSEEEDME